VHPADHAKFIGECMGRGIFSVRLVCILGTDLQPKERE